MTEITKRNRFSIYVLLLGILISLIVGFQVYKTLEEKDQIRFTSISTKIVQNIKDRFDTYREVLYSGVGLFKVMDGNVSRNNWHVFVKELQLEKYYPGIQGVGYSTVLYDKDLEANIKKIRAEGFKEYKIYPEGKREFYTSIIYLEPFDWRNQRAFGYDMYSNDVRRTAMKRAIETTQSSLSGKVRLVQEDGKDEQAGFLLYLPLYKKGLPLDTVEQRYKALKGFVYSPFRAKDFMLGVVNDTLDFVQLKVYDTDTINSENLLFNSIEDGVVDERLNSKSIIDVDGHSWSIEITALDSFHNSNYFIVSAIATFTSLLITLLIYNIIRRQSEILKLKDEALLGVSQVIIITDKHKKIIYVNKAFEDVTGYTAKEVIGKSPKILQGELSDKKTIEKIRIQLKKLKPFIIEILNYKKDGSTFWNRVSITPIFDSNGNIERFIGIQDNITIQKEEEQKVLLQKEEYESIFNYSKDGIAIMDLETNFLRFNESYKDLTGYSIDELSKKTYLSITAPEDIERSKRMIENVVETGSMKNFEKTYILKDGQRLKVNCSISLLPDNRLLIVAKDMTSIKLLEEQARLASMGEMIGNIAHQWRQPLSVISTSASAVKLHKELGMLEDEKIINSMDLIVRETRFLSKTIDDFKNFIKGSKTFTNCNVKDIINETVLLMNASLKNNYIETIVNVENDGVIYANKGQITQAMINIINNAKDALNGLNKEDDKFIFISTRKVSSDKLVIDILDNAKGIDETIIDRIFEPYFTTKHQSIGTGIGLNMTHKILVENHSYSLNVYNKEFNYENKQYKGACFSIELKTV